MGTDAPKRVSFNRIVGYARDTGVPVMMPGTPQSPEEVPEEDREILYEHCTCDLCIDREETP